MTTGTMNDRSSRSETVVSAVAVFGVSVVAGMWAAGFLTFPRPEDVAYYVGVARNLVEGRGLVTDAIWSYQTPPLVFPRPAFEVWLPLPTFLAAGVMAIGGTTFAAAQLSAIVVAGLMAVLAWRLGLDVAAERGLPAERARAIGLGSGLTAGVCLPLVLAAAEPDSTIPFAALALAACLLMARLGRARPSRVRLVGLGVVLGLAALTRNEVIWLSLAWAVVAWQAAGRIADGAPGAQTRGRVWLELVAVPGIVTVAIYTPWAIRDWLTFGSPLPGQALANALSLDGRDIFAWRDRPTLERYLAAGLPHLIGLRWTGFVHNAANLLVLGAPTSLIGLIGLPLAWRLQVLRPVLLYSVITFMVSTLVFPVSSTWGTFLHAAGAIHVLIIVSALWALDGVIERVRRRRAWTRPVAWIAPLATVAAGLLLTATLLPGQADAARRTAARYAALPIALRAAGAVLQPGAPPVITDFPIWLAEATRHPAIALPNEPPDSVLDLAAHFGGASILVIDRANGGIWPEILESGVAGAECFQALPLTGPPEGADALEDVVAYRISCP
ncbi:MAG TPA: hypothetical protein VEX41_05175 [Candidatus Eisenbacteria bacterium]|nr:hypothetical protein [Candidatus Eisenbacteria bacterium]